MWTKNWLGKDRWHTDNRNAAFRLDKDGELPNFPPRAKARQGKGHASPKKPMKLRYHCTSAIRKMRLSTGLDKQTLESPGMDIYSIAKTFIVILCV